MDWDSYNSVEDFGYKFNEDGRLVNILDGSEFNVTRNRMLNYEKFEALTKVITEYVYKLLQSDDIGLKKLEIPQEKRSSTFSFAKQENWDEAKGFIFVSKDFDKKDRLLVLVHGAEHNLRAGQWSSWYIIHDCLDHGTQIPYIRQAIKDGYGVVVTNTNQNKALVGNTGKKTYKSIKESESPKSHFSYVWKNIIEKTSASKIFAIAHRYGGYLVVECFNGFPKIPERVVAVAFIGLTDTLKFINARAEVERWFLKNSVNWYESNNKLDTSMCHQDVKNHVNHLSAGTVKYEEIPWKAMESVFKYLQNKQLDFDRKKNEVGTWNESKKSDNSTEQDGMNEYVEVGEELKGVEEIKKNYAIVSASSKPENGSEPNKKGTNTFEMSKKASKETKSREEKSESDFDKNALKSGSETPGEVKDKEVGKHKPENSPVQDEKNKSIEGPWMWIKYSVIHRDKFEKLIKYGQDPSKIIKEINNVRVCFSEEFLVGWGSDGTRVYVGLGRDGYERAVKRIQRDILSSAEQEKKALNERNALKSNHVIRYRYLDIESDNDWVFLIMDLCEETLKQYVKRSSSDDWSQITRNVIRQVLKGLADLHGLADQPKCILHRDLKPSNILRNVDNEWLIADFDISRILTQDQTTHRSKERGTKYWKAVESSSFKDKSNDAEVRYKRESDIQVAGMVAFYTMTKGEHPFGEEPDRDRNLRNGDPIYLDKLEDPVAKDLISWMLSHDSKERPTAEQALKHPYLLSLKQQFELLSKMGNQPEIKTEDTSSSVVRELNNDLTDWQTLMDSDVLKYLCTVEEKGKLKTFKYRSSWTQCLRLIRNVDQHKNDKPRPLPQPAAFGDPQEYFLKKFPNLAVVVHRIVRKCDWKDRPDLKEFFI